MFYGIRFAEAKQVGDMVALLLSERAGGNFMTGSDVVLDGGKPGMV